MDSRGRYKEPTTRESCAQFRGNVDSPPGASDGLPNRASVGRLTTRSQSHPAIGIYYLLTRTTATVRVEMLCAGNCAACRPRVVVPSERSRLRRRPGGGCALRSRSTRGARFGGFRFTVRQRHPSQQRTTSTSPITESGDRLGYVRNRDGRGRNVSSSGDDP